MKMNTKRIRMAVMFLLGILLAPLSLQAQNVTIRANNGSTVAAIKQGTGQGVTDTFFGAGGFATWQHEQLSMVLTTSDGTALTPNGQLDNPANNLFSDTNGHMQIGKGQSSATNICYATVSLPKGYRFTGYSIKFSKSTETKGSGTGAISFNSSVTGRFGETGSDFSTYTTQADVTNTGGAKTITRTEMTEGDMGNVLYFKLMNTTNSNQNQRVLITLESAEFFFTAEENYSPVTPAGEITSPVSAVDVPFPTSRVDFGTIENRPYVINGVTYNRVSYSSANVSDLAANFKLYEAESVTDGTDLDNVPGKVVDYKAGTISSDGGYFKLGREGQEQIYFLESPTTVTISDGHEVPVGYRITEAEFEYTNQITAVRTFYITYTSYGTKYYLNTEGRFTTTRVVWEMDPLGYISSNGYYLYFNNGYASTQREKPAATERFGVDDSNNFYQLQWPDYFITYYAQGWINPTRYGLISNTSGNKAVYEEITHQDPVGDFTLNIYDKTGKSVYASKSDGAGTVKLTGLNNDAVKFGVQGIGLVRATLTLQALDPYLNSMDVVCQDEVQTEVRMEQDFTASDFSVSGGEFYFYLPKDCEGHQVAITFENLHSKYFDESYAGGTAGHTSRINFVKSEHYNAFGASHNSLYNDTAEAANAQKERLKVGIVGTQGFRFNNADEVGTSGGVLREFPFSLEEYNTAGGDFTDMKFTVSASDQVATRYVFTTDETRYNIAPTTATQHRAYAYYQMIVHVQSATYEPEVEFKKIYDQTLYGTGQEDAFYGAVITAMAGDKPGYSSTQEIYKIIDAAIKAGVDDTGNTDVPASSEQLLYLDFSQLAGVYQITTEEHQSMEDYAATGAANCLIFLPKGHGAPNNNVAAMLESGGFQAAHNIVITDMQPFYSPYDIQVSGANYVEYKRQITNPKNGKVTSASVILPFNILVDENGQHTNVGEDGIAETAPAFSLHKMQATNCLTTQPEDDTEEYADYVFFPAVEVAKTTTANTPYLVKVLNGGEGDTISFVVRQRGGTISATTGMDASKYTFQGESATGSADGTTYNFTAYGSYSGKKVPKSENVFYFAKNMFLNTKDLVRANLNVAPFRSYYATQAEGGAKLSLLNIIFGEGEGNADAVRDLRQQNADLAVKAGRGTLTITSTIDNRVRIASLSGVSHYNLAVGAGETKTVSVPAGIYVVNGVKILVK